MKCNDFNKIKPSILQLASVDVSHIYLLNDFGNSAVISNKHKDEQTVSQSVRLDTTEEPGNPAEQLYVIFFLLGDFPASKFYVPTFWNTLSIPASWMVWSSKNNRAEIARVFIQVKVWLKNTKNSQK